MSRLANAILQAGTGFSQGIPTPMVDVTYGAQMGYTTELTEWVSNAAYVRRNVIPILLEAPKGFQYLNNPDYWVGVLRALVELHPLSIEGLNATLEVDVVSNPLGGGGLQQEDPTNVTQTPSAVTFRWGEKYGMPIGNFMRGWITNLIMDPDSKYPNVVTVASPPTDMLPDMYTMSMLFIEPDPTHTKVNKAWVMANMMPKTSGEITGRRDMTQANETPTYDIAFTGFHQFGPGVNQFAQQILTAISMTGANPQDRAAFITAIDADVSAAKKSYAASVSDTAAANVVTA